MTETHHEQHKQQFHTLTESESEIAIDRFCKFIQFPTISSLAAADGTYEQCAKWLYNELVNAKKQVVDNDITTTAQVFDDVFMLPKGGDETLPILLLNSHYDVVPAMDIDWTVAPPFAGLRQNGNIYGRGTQDMKCVCIQYMEAIIKIQQLYPNYKPKRDIYLLFVPDEGIVF
jgi:aminoacylase